MRKLLATTAIVAAAILMSAPAAQAGPPHGEGGHLHHVHTGNGECVQLDAHAFLPEARGLHRAAAESGFERAVWHGPCH